MPLRNCLEITQKKIVPKYYLGISKKLPEIANITPKKMENNIYHYAFYKDVMQEEKTLHVHFLIVFYQHCWSFFPNL